MIPTPTSCGLRGLLAHTLLLSLVALGCSDADKGMTIRRAPGPDGAVEAGSEGGAEDAGEGTCNPTCGEGERCDPDTDRCVDVCADKECGAGQSCEARDSRAECVADCDTLSCDEGERCDESAMRAVCVPLCDPPCAEGQACVDSSSGGTASCEDQSCPDLDCQLPEVCSAAGSGHVCEDASCESDKDCGTGLNCFEDPAVGGYCVGNVCTPGERQCSGDATNVEECLPNGSGWFDRHTCSGATCSPDGGAHCPCVDDWDCPANTACEVERCEGTGVDPTCFVSVAAMEDVLPAVEFQWGTSHDRADDDSSVKLAAGHPFPQSPQVVTTPLVVNLNDDNGDGLINEQDYPEILFLTTCSTGNFRWQTNGVLRAVHGGGTDADGNPLAGKDYFASGYRCDPTGPDCSFAPENQLVWNEGEDGDTDSLDGQFSGCGAQVIDSTGSLAVGNLDGDPAGSPEIVAVDETAHVLLFDAKGNFIARSNEAAAEFGSGAPLIANLDGAGLPEIAVGRNVWTLQMNAGVLSFGKAFVGNSQGAGINGNVGLGPVSCAADLDGDGRQEIIAGGAALVFPDPTTCGASPCTMQPLWTSNAVPETEGFCAVADVWGASAAVPPHPVDNPLDGKPEVIVVRSGTVYVLNGLTGATLDTFDVAGSGGGPPNVDDFDGDGLPEIGTAGSAGYSMIDLQTANDAAGCPMWPNQLAKEPITGDFATDRGPYPASMGGNPARVVPTEADGSAIACQRDTDCNEANDPQVFACNESTGECVCLHNGWSRSTQDSSSEATGSSVFDFNGDGAAEIVYNDECFFRVYGGIDGRLYSRIPSESRTRTEYPVVADLDNDGNAEIVFGVSNESGYCGSDAYRTVYNAGLEVWGEPGDLWVSARRTWNQHSYHITNVTEGGEIPLVERASWDPTLRTERGYNSYRSNPPSRAGIAPDLQVVEVNVGASGGGCEALGDEIDISARIRNAGDLRVGADVQVAFVGIWGNMEVALTDAMGDPLVTTLGSPLRAKAALTVSVTYDVRGKTPAGLPDRVRVIVDPDDKERECDDPDDDDNSAEAEVVTPDLAADLTLSLDDVTGSCPDKTVAFTVTNDGAAPASDVVVRFYQGNPAGGATVLGMTTVKGPIEPGESVSDTAKVTFPPLEVTLFGEVDPDDEVPECSDSNNGAKYDMPINCLMIPI